MAYSVTFLPCLPGKLRAFASSLTHEAICTAGASCIPRVIHRLAPTAANALRGGWALLVVGAGYAETKRACLTGRITAGPEAEIGEKGGDGNSPTSSFTVSHFPSPSPLPSPTSSFPLSHLPSSQLPLHPQHGGPGTGGQPERQPLSSASPATYPRGARSSRSYPWPPSPFPRTPPSSPCSKGSPHRDRTPPEGGRLGSNSKHSLQLPPPTRIPSRFPSRSRPGHCWQRRGGSGPACCPRRGSRSARQTWRRSMRDRGSGRGCRGGQSEERSAREGSRPLWKGETSGGRRSRGLCCSGEATTEGRGARSMAITARWEEPLREGLSERVSPCRGGGSWRKGRALSWWPSCPSLRSASAFLSLRRWSLRWSRHGAGLALIEGTVGGMAWVRPLG